MREDKRLVVEIEEELKYKFKLATMKNKTDMRTAVLDFIREYIK